MKLDAPDHRKAITINFRLEAATYDLVQQYEEYAKTLGQYFKTDGQLMTAVVTAFLTKKVSPDFFVWLKAQQMPVGKKNGKKEEVYEYKATYFNGDKEVPDVDLSAVRLNGEEVRK